ELALRVWRIENDDSWLLSAALWVFAHTTGTGVTRMRNALVPSWLLSAAMVRSTRSVPPTVSEAMWAASGVAGPVCRRSTGRQAIGLASGSGVALRMWVAPSDRRSPTALPHPAAHR